MTHAPSAQVLQYGITHRDPLMRRLAAEQLPSLCERRPVEQYVVDRFITLLEDPEWRVRRSAIEHLTELCEPEDAHAVKAVVRRSVKALLVQLLLCLGPFEQLPSGGCTRTHIVEISGTKQSLNPNP